MNENMLPVGTVLRAGAYRIERQISSGGFGNTYVVRNISFDEVYAMKEFFMKGVNLRNGSDVTVSITDNKATFESQRNKFKKEAIRLRKLDNPHIVKVHDLFEENGTVYYTMDYIDGQSLADVIKERGPLKEKEALDIFRQMLDALSVVHGQNPPMLHLDIKPANIMLDKNGNAFLLDFGSSKQIDSDGSLTTVSGFTLSKDYAPMELIGGNKDRIGPWSDLYELGATLYYLLAGIQPPTSSELSIDGEESFKFPESVSSSTRQLIRWMMTLAPSKRPNSVAELQERIGLSESPVSGPEQQSKPRPEVPAPKPQKPTGGGNETILGDPNGLGDDDKTILTGDRVTNDDVPNSQLGLTYFQKVLGYLISVICGVAICVALLNWLEQLIKS